jgi:hypothetical protein
MQGEGDKGRYSAKENPVGQNSAKNEYGEIGERADSSAGSAPPRSLGTKGMEFGQMADYDRGGQQGQSGTGQADLGNQAATTLAGHADQQDLGTDQPGRVGGAGGSTIEGFIGAQGSGSGDYLQEPESASSAKATQGTDFAHEGRGAAEDEDDDASEAHPS